MVKVIDIHSHILYGIDDGSQSELETMTLIEYEYTQGVRGIFLTNHSICVISRYDEYQKNYENIIKKVKKKYKDLKLYQGCEIMCDRETMKENISCIREGIYPTMNGTEYVLVEFDPYDISEVEEMDYCLKYILDAGYIPIIAHAERYKNFYKDPVEDIMRAKEMGCKVQVNLYSIDQDRGTKDGGARKILANEFLKEHLVDFVGTDAHRTNYKLPEVMTGSEALRIRYGDEYGAELLYRNAEKLLKA